jgi:hypothetical protein
MCVPIPVSDNLSKKGKVTGGISTPAQGIVNQMMTPFRRAAGGDTLVEQRQRFSDPRSMAALLTAPALYNPQRTAPVGDAAVPPGPDKRPLTEAERRRYIGRDRGSDTGNVSGADMQRYIDNKGFRRPY